MSKFNDTLSRVTEVIADHLGLNPEEVASTASLVEDLGADSLDSIELVMGIEEEFDIEITEEQAETAVTVQAIADLVDSLRA